MAELFTKLQKQTMQCGIDPISFWDYTIGELKLIVDNYVESKNNETKEKFAYSYNNACLIASFVCRGLNGEKLPPIHEIYPDMFVDEQKVDEERQKAMLSLYKEQFIDFANARNKKLREQKNEG